MEIIPRLLQNSLVYDIHKTMQYFYIPILFIHFTCITHKVQNDQQTKRFTEKSVKRLLLSWMKALLSGGNPFVWKHSTFSPTSQMFNILDLCGKGSQSDLVLLCDNAANKMVPIKEFQTKRTLPQHRPPCL
jgi:hypothetical protein